MSDFNHQIISGLKELFKFRKETKEWLREGKCPDCKDWSLFTASADPKVVKCGHTNRCRFEVTVRKALPDLFDDWSKRFKRTEEQPNAAADNYLSHLRGLNISRIAGSYVQEFYSDTGGNNTSATVRFALENGAWWERIIDRPWRFGDKKANFAWGKSYKGFWWQHPQTSIEQLAQAEEIWFVEGIFDCCALVENGVFAVSLMSTNNYPGAMLDALRKAAAAGPTPTRLPTLIWAFDQGESGLRESRKGMKRARVDGWKVAAAQTTPDGEGEKEDWNDLHIAKRLTKDHLAEYRWNGDYTFETIATKKARLFYNKTSKRAFYLTLNNQFYWCRVRSQTDTEGQEHSDKVEAERISDFAFTILYRIWDEAIDEARYAIAIRFPDDRRDDVITVPSSALSGSGDFKKQMLKAAGVWKGASQQLDHIIEKMDGRKKTVLPLDFYGYSKDHKAWVWGDLAVRKGVVKRLNEHQFFDFGKIALRLKTSHKQFGFAWDIKSPKPHDTGWYAPLVQSFGARGIVTLAFWTMSFFAEQIRARHGSLGFLEMAGDPNTGKSTIITFLWKLSGRLDNYEGFDPAKGSAAANNRNFARYANVPVVLMEGDRDKDMPHSRRFDFDELKPLWNGNGLAERGMKNGGNETYAPPFKAAIIIEQNEPVNAQPATMTRIMHLKYDASHFSPATAEAVEIVKQWPADEASTWMIHVIRQEEKLLETFFKRTKIHQQWLRKETGVTVERLLINHGQLAAAVDMLKTLLPMTPVDHEAAMNLVAQMTTERLLATSTDHPTVQKFWDFFDALEIHRDNKEGHFINGSRNPGEIAVNLPHFESRCRSAGLLSIDFSNLHKHLRSSKRRKFIAAKTVNTQDRGGVHCWVFARETASTTLI